MAILNIAKLGNPILRKVAAEVTEAESQNAAFQRLIDDMVETMQTRDGVGLAAPQVFISKQLTVIESNPNSRYPSAPQLPLLIMLNPTITDHSEEKSEGWEGCLSLDNLRGKVPRSVRICVKGFNRYMEPVAFDAEGFLAVVIQHETDHLVGKVFLDRMNDFSTLTHLAEFNQFWSPRSVAVA